MKEKKIERNKVGGKRHITVYKRKQAIWRQELAVQFRVCLVPLFWNFEKEIFHL